MRKLQFILILALLAFSGCGKDNFFDKFPPEILFYQNADVENADFNAINLTTIAGQYTVKARVSAPYKLKNIMVYKSVGSLSTNQELIMTYSDFTLTPNVAKINTLVPINTQDTYVKIVATDMNNKVSTKIFTINVTP